MNPIITDRVSPDPTTDVVVFLIGMRLNKPWKVWKWLPLFFAMGKMLRELQSNPELGLLLVRNHFGFPNISAIQYWKSAAHLQAFARAADKSHLPAWQDFNKNIGTNGDVGIWHETYIVPPGRLEAIYANMPRYGLGLITDLHPAKGTRATAAKRLHAINP